MSSIVWLGYLNEFPEYLTQGVGLEDLIEHLLDLSRDLPKVLRGK
jgi:hypothetical protein